MNILNNQKADSKVFKKRLVEKRVEFTFFKFTQSYIFPFLCLRPGFDHQHPEVYEHCKRLLLHLLVVQGANSNVQSVAMVLLRNRDYNEPRVLTVKPAAPEFNLTGV